MDNILQGTTPTITIAIDPTDFAVSDVIALEFSFKQKNNISVYGLQDVTVDTTANTVSYTFTQAETLAFIPDILLSVQLRFMFADGNIVGTDRMNFNIDDLISSEVLSS
jgi:hypothetical protein